MPTNLPLELWQIIMRDAVHIRGALETVITTQFEWLEWQYDEDGVYEESIQTRWTLVQVCKAWYCPALERLYEDIRLQSLEHMESLRECLGESSKSGSHPARGWWTKRLDTPDLGGIDDPLLEPLITHFPNLCILRFYNADSIRNIRVSIPKLRYTHLEPNEDSLISPNLDTVILSAMTRRTFTFHTTTSLEVVIDAWNPSILEDYSFPNLQHLILSNAIEDCHIPALEAFLHRYGQQLLSLRMDGPQFHFASDIERFLRKTPNIRELILLPDDSVPEGDNTFPSVTHIGTLGGSVEAFRNPFFSSIRFPKLKCMRLVDNLFQYSELVEPEFQDWYENGRPLGVRYEDVYGEELSIVVDEAHSYLQEVART